MFNVHKLGSWDKSKLLGAALLLVLLVGTALAINFNYEYSGFLHEVVNWVSIGTFSALVWKAYKLYKAGRTIVAAVSAVGSPVLSLAVYILGSWVISAVAHYGVHVVASW
ncbi:hypothetical protein QS257_00160 [Terrilactibacillus sp. S3-3]|nr:hypothetical protein QS257_00160 [Terrilactibacillus sp. S3-3]